MSSWAIMLSSTVGRKEARGRDSRGKASPKMPSKGGRKSSPGSSVTCPKV